MLAAGTVLSCVGWFALGAAASWMFGFSSCTSHPQPKADLLAPEAEVAQLSYSPPAGHGKVAVPSVLHDARGSIHNLEIGGFRFNVLVSEAGALRSGDLHPNHQLDLVFSGRVRVYTREAGRSVVHEYRSGSLIVIERHVPHIFEFLNRTVMAEWWDGPFAGQYYRPFRQIVDAGTDALRADEAKVARRVVHRGLASLHAVQLSA